MKKSLFSKETQRFLAVIALILCIFMGYQLNKHILVRTYKVYGDTMLPLLSHGDTIETHILAPDTIERGQVILMKSLYDSATETWVRRIIAVEGDTIECVDGIIYLNGEVLEEDYLDPYFVNQMTTQYGHFNTDFEKITIDEDYMFVLCDNRPACEETDSRYRGEIETSKILSHNVYLVQKDETLIK